MCKICDKYRAGKVLGKDAMRAISEAMDLTKDPANKLRLEKHLFELAEEILNNDVPMPERNEQADKDFWNSTHKEEENE